MALFDLGRIEISHSAAEALAGVGADVAVFLDRHRRGDPGRVDEDRRRVHEWALRHSGVVYSTYSLRDDVNLLIGTSRDRSYTCVMLETEFEPREVSTREGYARWADYYDHERNPLVAVEEPLVDAILEGLDVVATALDVGSGTGRLSLKLARGGIAVTAVDPSPEMIAVARENARRQGLTIDFHSGAFEEGLPCQEAQFDLAVCTLVLCHVPDLFRAVSEMVRVVREGGYLLITDFHPDGVAIGWRTTVTRPGERYLLPNMPHTRADYLEAVGRAGCTVLDVRDVPLRAVPEGYLAHHDDLIREHGDVSLCLIVLAQKTCRASS